MDIFDKNIKPNISELLEFTRCRLFYSLYEHMQTVYSPTASIEYSGDKVLLGWNIKYKKNGRTLCTVYPREGHFFLLLIVGNKERERVEELLKSACEEMSNIYYGTKEGMGQRWMLFDFEADCELYRDVLRIVDIRRHAR